MGKRSNFERIENDAYYSPYKAVAPLIPYLPPNTKFADLCAGNGGMARHIEKHGHSCIYQSDIDPQREGIERRDYLFFGGDIPSADMYIMNPPWEREILHPTIELFRNLAPTWLLFDSDWMFTGQAKEYKKYCELIVTVGRISWMGNGTAGKDNCCWYKFGKNKCDTILI